VVNILYALRFKPGDTCRTLGSSATIHQSKMSSLHSAPAFFAGAEWRDRGLIPDISQSKNPALFSPGAGARTPRGLLGFLFFLRLSRGGDFTPPSLRAPDSCLICSAGFLSQPLSCSGAFEAAPCLGLLTEAPCSSSLCLSSPQKRNGSVPSQVQSRSLALRFKTGLSRPEKIRDQTSPQIQFVWECLTNLTARHSQRAHSSERPAFAPYRLGSTLHQFFLIPI
jgi:hypothetical protein